VDKTEARITLMDDKLWDYPFIHVTGHGNIKFSDAENRAAPRYLARGGFLHVDDNYGLDESFRREIKRVFPIGRWWTYPLTHPIYHSSTTFPRAFPRFTSTTGFRPAGSGSSSETASRCITPFRAISGTVGRSRGLPRSSGVHEAALQDGRESVRIRCDQPAHAMTVIELVDRERTRLRRMHVIAGLALAVGATLLLLAGGTSLLGCVALDGACHGRYR
jgi:hypothetical protein